MNHIIPEVARCYSCYRRHGYGGGYGDYWIASWLWRQIGWWTIPVASAAFFLFAFIKRLIVGPDDD